MQQLSVEFDMQALCQDGDARRQYGSDMRVYWENCFPAAIDK